MLMFQVCLHLCTCIAFCSCALQIFTFEASTTCKKSIELSLDGDIETKAESVIACAVLCSEKAECGGFLYYSGTKACHIVNADSAMVAACALPGTQFYKVARHVAIEEFYAPGQDPTDPTSVYSINQRLNKSYSAPEGKHVKVSIYDGEIECVSSANCVLFEDVCWYDRIIIYDGGIRQPSICGTFSLYEYFSESSHVEIDWLSDSSGTYGGFRIVVEYIEN